MRLLIFVLLIVLLPFNFRLLNSTFLAESEHCLEEEGDLMRDLWIVDLINSRLCDRMPVTYNNLLLGGYINMPSARMGCEGEVGIGYSWVPPYNNYNVRVQPLDRLEVSGNYRVFRGIQDCTLSQHGFGDLSDKGVNAKFSIIHPEDTDYILPGVAFGYEDFLGTRAFRANYIVLTQVLLKMDLELTLGYGWERINGFFGGALWMPFRKSCFLWGYLQNFSLTVEYDAIDYENPAREPHPHGRVTKSPINFGFKYRLWEIIDLGVSQIRGHEYSASIALNYNLGTVVGVPKIDDPLPYRSPMITECIGVLRPEEAMVDDFLFALDEQGFILSQAWLGRDCRGGKVLRLNMYTCKYRYECDIKERITHLLAFLTPSDISEVIVVMETEGFPSHEYHFDVIHLERFREGCIGDFEMAVLSPMEEATFADPCLNRLLYDRPRATYNLYVTPDLQTLFGSAKGKLKAALGICFGSDGFLWDNIYYSLGMECIALSGVSCMGDIDMINPSQLINVHSDRLSYLQSSRFAVNFAYFQKCWNLGCGWFARAAAGYIDRAYGGGALEFLYYPVCSIWAVGIEAAYVRKRNYVGLGFNNKIRKLDGFIATYLPYQTWQAFIDFYYHWQEAELDFEVNFGHFLAGDIGTRFEVARYFCNGFKVYAWVTYTNGHDRINNQIYYDKGIGFSMPLDIFFTRASRRNWGYGMSAWLRDVGYRVPTGHRLHELLYREREE